MSESNVILADAAVKEHDIGSGQPEQPARFDAALRGVAGWPVTTNQPRIATNEEIALCHDRRYIQLVEREVAAGFSEVTTGDTYLCPKSLDAARRATGTVLAAADLVASGAAKNAFCIVRPPGHHATPTRGMGFCLFNNVAIGARYAQARHGIARVLIADWDVYHGNGTQDIFYRDGSVLFFSTHQSPWYPGTGAAGERGEGKGEGRTINCPFPAGSGRAEIVGAFRDQLLPAANEFQPDLVMISAGFDSRIGDPLGRFLLTDGDFAELTQILLDIADRHAGGRLISVLEGGYDLDGLSRAVHAHVNRLRQA